MKTIGVWCYTWLVRLTLLTLLCGMANGAYGLHYTTHWDRIPLLLVALLLFQLLPSLSAWHIPGWRLRLCYHGAECLLLFLLSATVSVGYQTWLAFRLLPERWLPWTLSLLVCLCTESLLFWNGILTVYATSVQLGLRYRVLGVLLGWIPLVNIVMLGIILRVVYREVHVESAKIRQNEQRRAKQICHTRYPILLVHGVFFRDSRHLNYWGRIPGELQTNGAQIFYGNHPSAASVADSAAELAERIRSIVSETGCEKVNIIAHSKGGLDCRYALGQNGIAPYVASLTTINTPHRGCEFADYLLHKVPQTVQQRLAVMYNAIFRRLGDARPDFLAAVYDLTASRCREREPLLSDPPDIVYQSVGSRLNRATNGKFPLNFSYTLVRHFDGPNDGLVAESSFRWGESYTFVTVPGKRGISHADMIDLNRENISQFDVREFYVRLVAGLKQRGL